MKKIVSIMLISILVLFSLAACGSSQESAEELCSKCDEYARDWAPVAEEIWNSTSHRDTHTQYYRDTEEGKKEFGGCTGNCANCGSHK